MVNDEQRLFHVEYSGTQPVQSGLALLAAGCVVCVWEADQSRLAAWAGRGFADSPCLGVSHLGIVRLDWAVW